MVIAIGNCSFRPIATADVAVVHGWMDGPEMQAKMEDQALTSREITAKLAGLVGQDPVRDRQGAYMIEHDARPIGFVHLMWINWISRTAEVDLIVDPALHRSFRSFWVVQKAGEVAFEFLNLNKVYAFVYASNLDSIGMFRRLLRIEALLPAGRRPPEGDEDVYIVGLTAAGYRARKRRLTWTRERARAQAEREAVAR
jgi:RimJ/RimL family protein N-acetyltransferase